jgi:hypothetical protein
MYVTEANWICHSKNSESLSADQRKSTARAARSIAQLMRTGKYHPIKDSAQVTDPGAIISTIAAVSSRPIKQNRSTCSRMPMPIAACAGLSCEPVHTGEESPPASRQDSNSGDSPSRFWPSVDGWPSPSDHPPGRNEDRDVTPPVVRDRASASVAEDSAGKLAAGPAPIERRVEPRRRRDAHEVSPRPDRAGGHSGRVL